MKYEMIVTDLDRTLLNDQKEISLKNLDALYKCKGLGYKIVFATARPKRAVLPYLKLIELDALVVHNGAGIYMEEKEVEQIGIERKDINYLLTVAYTLKNNYGISIEVDDVHYANFDISGIWPGNEFIMTDFKDLPHQLIDKMIIHIEHKQDIEYFKEHVPENLYFEMSEGLVGLIMNKKATKLNAIKRLIKLFGIGLGQVIAFGDDLNDMSLLKAAGVGIAVSNASDEVKAVADRITVSNQEHGVARWLEENIL